MKIESTDPRVIRAGQAFPQRLQEVHEGRIVLRDTAIYRNMKIPIDVLCNVCSFEWETIPESLIYKKAGCPRCANSRREATAGTLRLRRPSAAEVELARRMRETGMSYDEIASVLGRVKETIRRWLVPKAREKNHQLSSEKYARDKESGKKAKLFQNYYQTKHGKQIIAQSHHERRSAKYHAVDYILMPDHPDAHQTPGDKPCGRRGFVKVDMYDEYFRGDKDTIEFFSFEGINETMKHRVNDRTKYQEWFGEEYEIDHILPLTKGGTHSPLNLKVIPKKENNSKLNKIRPQDIAEYCQRLFQTFNYF